MKTRLLILMALAASFASPVPAQLTTNEPLFRQFRAWEKAVRAGDSDRVMKEVDRTAAQFAGTREPVLSGPGWSYNWGFLAGLTKAWAEQWRERKPEAYRTLKNIEALKPEVPPPPPDDYHYWQWYLATGDACQNLGRLQDAEWYYRQVRNGVSTNDGHYWKATVALAGTLNRQGRLEDAGLLYDEILEKRPNQPPEVWKDYVEYLFDSGYFEEGVEVLLIGAELHGLSVRQGGDDYYAASIRRHWSLLSDAQIARWYERLGICVDTAELGRGAEDYLAVMINTRRVIEKAYPELVSGEADDLETLKSRATIESPPVTKGWRCHGGTSQGKGKKEGGAVEVRKPTVGGMRPVQLAIEDDVNRALLQTLAAKRKGYLPLEPWQKLLDKYSTNDLHDVSVDGMSALFHAYAALGASLSYSSKPVEAKEWLVKALEEAKAHDGFNAMRMGSALICMGDVYLNSWVKEPEEAARYLDWARTVVRGYRRQEALVLAGLAGVALMSGDDEGMERRIPLLQQVLDQYGCLPRRGIYERLARDYYRTGHFHEGFNTYEAGFKRANLMDDPISDHLVEGLVMTRSLHSASELARLRRLFRSGALRFPAKVEQAGAIAKMLDLSAAAWIGEHEELAQLEESGLYTSAAGWAVITNALEQHPSVRVGLLHSRAVLARERFADEPLDWRGWLMAWNLVQTEFLSLEPQAPTDTGGDVAVRGMLLDLLISHVAELTEEDFVASSEAIRNDAGNLSIKQLADAGEALVAESPEEAFRLHLAAMTHQKNTSVDHPSFQVLFTLRPQVSSELQKELVTLLHLKRKQAHDLDLKRTWEQALLNCGVEP